MGLIYLDGIGQVEVEGDTLDIETLKLVKEYQKQKTIEGGAKGITGTASSKDRDEFGNLVAPEVSSKVRFAVSAAPNLESKVKTLKKFYDKVEQDEMDPSNFIVTDKQGKKFLLDDKTKTNFGDVIDFSREAGQVVGGTIGAIKGTAFGAGVGAIPGAGLGTAAGTETIELLGRLAGTEIERDIGDYAVERLGDVAFGAIGQAVGPLVLKGAKRLISGPQQIITRETAEGGVEKVTEMAIKLEEFATAGVKPTLTQVTENKLTDFLGGVFSKFPVAANILKSNAIKQQNDLGDNVVKIAYESMAGKGAAKGVGKVTAATGEEAGKAVKIGSENFISNFRGESAIKYGAVNNAIPRNTPIMPNATQAYLKQAVADSADLQSFEKLIGDPFVTKMLQALEQNVAKSVGAGGQPTLPYAQFKALRTNIGNKISNYNINEPASRAFYKGLYKSLVTDIQAGAKTLGDDTFNLLKAADDFTLKNSDLIDDFVRPILNKVNLDDITNKILTDATKGSTSIKAIRSILKDPEYDVVVSNIIDKLGKTVTPELIESTGEVVSKGARTNFFNTETFLTNWSKMPEASKQVLFNSSKNLKSLKKDIDTISRVADTINKANPFGKQLYGESPRFGGQGLIIGGAAGLAGGLATGAGIGSSLAFLTAIPLVGWGGAQAAKLFSNPKVLNWIATGVKASGNKGFDGFIENFGRVGTVMANADPESRVLMNQTLGVIGDILGTAPKQKQEPRSQVPTAQPVAQATPTPTSPPANIFAANTPGTPMTTGVTPTAQPMDKAQQYAGLFPFDVTGQQIARQG
jgi:hypothetical protein